MLQAATQERVGRGSAKRAMAFTTWLRSGPKDAAEPAMDEDQVTGGGSGLPRKRLWS